MNNEALKNSAPLVFVDMPGFDSPISSHTHAILEYLERGVHFVILTSVDSKEKALEEIKALDLGVKDIEKTYEKSRANLEEEYSSVAVGSVVKKVIEDVREEKLYLASLINKPNELNSEIEVLCNKA
ncbi:hypothetical protein MPG67_02635 [Helicobacter pylori]|uniref:hypothetical protein n=1 Tax=Helicobacter pylori TaxID=210 RepID=UPI001FD017EB|nr:hypothetical protein [Helicobacter pylori]UOS16251.1 hypothetical protein MPG85_02460 [Helicobacter pylori]UOS51306.1 hypothetical protein MPG67_02635 [Helicobacter pylori]